MSDGNAETRIRVKEVEVLLLSVESVARMTGLSTSTVYSAIAKGIIPSVQLEGGSGQRRLVPISKLRELIARLIREQIDEPAARSKMPLDQSF